jgi:hypothetical protein
MSLHEQHKSEVYQYCRSGRTNIMPACARRGGSDVPPLTVGWYSHSPRSSTITPHSQSHTHAHTHTLSLSLLCHKKSLLWKWMWKNLHLKVQVYLGASVYPIHIQHQRFTSHLQRLFLGRVWYHLGQAGRVVGLAGAVSSRGKGRIRYL